MKNLFFFFATLFFTAPVFSQNNALTFNSDYVTINSNMGLGTTNITGECWVNLPSASEKGTFINIGGDPNGYAIGVGGPGFLGTNFDYLGNELIILYDQQRWIPTGFDIGTGWNHVAFTIDPAGTACAFLNGILVFTSPGALPHQPSNITSIGASTSTGGRPLTNGTIDEVRIWNVPLGEGDIRANMYQELVGNETNLVAYYKFNETIGTTLNDETANNYNGTLVGINFTDHAIPSPAFFGPKNCLNFDGLNDNVFCSSISPTVTSGSIEFWVNLEAIPTDNARLISRGENYSSGDEIYLLHHDGRIHTNGSFVVGDNLVSTDPLPTNVWTHVAISADGSGSKLYINGILDDTGGAAAFSFDSFRFGGQLTDGSYEGINGMMDEVRLWNDVRTESEIRKNMFKTLVGIEPDLVAYYNLDNANGTVAQSYPTVSNDGLVSGATWVTSTAFNTWLNTDDSDWATASNWSNGVPGTTDNVGIYNFYNGPTSSAELSMNNLYLGTDANFSLTGSIDINANAFLNSSLNIAGGKYMTVDGQLSIAYINKASNLTIASGASLITYDTIIGDAIIEKTLAQDSKWHLVSVTNNNTTTTDFDGFYLQEWDELTSNWIEVTDLDVPMPPCKGYGLYDIPAKTTFQFSGTPNTGVQEINIYSNSTVVDTAGMNLIGNPYPSAIDLDVIDPDYGAFHVWNPATNDYEEYNGGAGDIRYLAPLQGFFVYAETNETFTIDNTARTHQGANTFYKSPEAKIENGIVLSTNQQDKLFIKLMNEANDDFDFIYDAYKIVSLGNGISQLYSKNFDTKLAIDCRPETDIIQLGFQNNKNGQYSIELVDIDGIAKAEIEDTKSNTFHNLSNGAYEFDWETTDSEERFILHLKATGTQELVEQEAQVYSNNGQIYIRQSSSQDFNFVKIFDLAGRVIYSSSLGQEELQSISLSNAKGVYLVQLSGDKMSQTEKVILN